MESARIFVDTNIFLHYQPIEDIPWKDVVDAEEAVICIAPIVIEELDDKKDSHRLSKIRERARKALQLIENSVGRDDFQVRGMPSVYGGARHFFFGAWTEER
jgi:predicted ribonuclease YlaK